MLDIFALGFDKLACTILYSNLVLTEVMNREILVVLLVAIVIHGCCGKSALRGMFPDKYPPMKQNGVDPGQPIFLTPYIQKGQYAQGKIQISYSKV